MVNGIYVCIHTEIGNRLNHTCIYQCDSICCTIYISILLIYVSGNSLGVASESFFCQSIRFLLRSFNLVNRASRGLISKISPSSLDFKISLMYGACSVIYYVYLC